MSPLLLNAREVRLRELSSCVPQSGTWPLFLNNTEMRSRDLSSWNPQMWGHENSHLMHHRCVRDLLILLLALEVECICGFEKCSPLFGGHNLCGFGNCITVCFVVRKIDMARNLSSWVPQRWGHVNYPLKFHRSEVTRPLFLCATVVSVTSYLVSHRSKMLPFIRGF